jgi:hypothetical protein
MLLLYYVEKVHGNVAQADELYCYSSIIIHVVLCCKLHFVRGCYRVALTQYIMLKLKP